VRAPGSWLRWLATRSCVSRKTLNLHSKCTMALAGGAGKPFVINENMRVTGLKTDRQESCGHWPRMNTECAGISRHGIGNERVLQERNSEPS
jgi:hypothetical protein